MKLNKLEKIFVVVVVLGLILIGGFFIFVYPCFANITSANKKLEANKAEQNALNDRLARLDTIDDDITSTQKNAKNLEGTFFPDLTTYETVETALAFLTANGFETHTVSVTAETLKSLSVESYTALDAEYDLKTLAQGAKDKSGEEEPVAGSFKDGSKTYYITINSLVDAHITDENGEEIAPSKFSRR